MKLFEEKKINSRLTDLGQISLDPYMPALLFREHHTQ
jgi:hypothetical protein